MLYKFNYNNKNIPKVKSKVFSLYGGVLFSLLVIKVAKKLFKISNYGLNSYNSILPKIYKLLMMLWPNSKLLLRLLEMDFLHGNPSVLKTN